MHPTPSCPPRARATRRAALLAALLLQGAGPQALAGTFVPAPDATGLHTALPAAPAPQPLCAPCTPVPEQRLATLRGGFDNGRGLQAGFGLERSVSVNGELVSRQTLHIGDLGRISALQARELQQVLGSVQLVRNGAGNTLDLPAGVAAGSTVIQNSLNDQTIRSSTLIEASTNSLQLLRTIATTGALRDALSAPLAPR